MTSPFPHFIVFACTNNLVLVSSSLSHNVKRVERKVEETAKQIFQWLHRKSHSDNYMHPSESRQRRKWEQTLIVLFLFTWSGPSCEDALSVLICRQFFSEFLLFHFINERVVSVEYKHTKPIPLHWWSSRESWHSFMENSLIRTWMRISAKRAMPRPTPNADGEGDLTSDPSLIHIS